jgi:drug/metabolite transporter (DMT)-like permease
VREVLTAIAAALLIPALGAVWSRRHGDRAGAAESLFWGLLILAATIVCFYFAVSLPVSGEDRWLDMLLEPLKIFLFADGAFGLMATAAITWESSKEFFGKKGK